jgi:8-oxo-dGTP diphosphatase
MKHLDVVAAVIWADQRILCVQRGTHRHKYIADKWEFPGGKIEHGEHHTDALLREISEELCLSITVDGHLLRVEHTYPDFCLTMHAYHCRLLSNAAELRLCEHADSKWLSPSDAAFLALDWAAADIPIVQALHSDAASRQGAE